MEDPRPTRTGTDWLFAIMFLDLDHFKDVNDTLGHAAGDELLRQVAVRIQRCLREADTLARLGGDEFAIMLDEAITSPAQVNEVAARVIQSVSEPYLLDGNLAAVDTSIGIALCGPSDTNVDPALLLRQADVALYRVKMQQRGSLCFFQAGMEAAVNRRKQEKLEP